jgi:hypothetical protein
MAPTLEGVLIALAMALTSTDASLERETPPVAPRPPEACAAYADPDQRRNCLVRIGRRAAAADVVYPTALHWVPSRDPGMATWMRLPNGLR